MKHRKAQEKNRLHKMSLPLSLSMTTQDTSVDSVYQDQTAQNVLSDLSFTLPTPSIFVYRIYE